MEALPPFRGFPGDRENANEEQNVAVLEGFFNSFRDGTIADYIANHFTENALYIPIQSDNSYYEVYNPELNAYSVAFSHERFLLTPPTREWQGITGAQNFIATLARANDMTDPITAFFPAKFVVNGDDIGVFGRFQFRNRSSGQISDTPFAYHIQLQDGRINFIQFYEDSYAYSMGARQGGRWTRQYDQTLEDFIFGTRVGETLIGSDRIDHIYGYQGDDTLEGKGGQDVLYGGQGSDRFILAVKEGTDTIMDFTKGEDSLQLPEAVTFNQLTLTQNGVNTDIILNQTQEKLATLQQVEANALDNTDFRLASDTMNLFWLVGIIVVLAAVLLIGIWQPYRNYRKPTKTLEIGDINHGRST